VFRIPVTQWLPDNGRVSEQRQQPREPRFR
jgi:hypothetical protein